MDRRSFFRSLGGALAAALALRFPSLRRPRPLPPAVVEEGLRQVFADPFELTAEQFERIYNQQVWALGIQLTREAQEDDLYDSLYPLGRFQIQPEMLDA